MPPNKKFGEIKDEHRRTDSKIISFVLSSQTQESRLKIGEVIYPYTRKHVTKQTLFWAVYVSDAGRCYLVAPFSKQWIGQPQFDKCGHQKTMYKFAGVLGR
jgi:hypothetical protein